MARFLQKLFRKRKRSADLTTPVSEGKTKPLSAERPLSSTDTMQVKTPHFHPPQLIAGCGQSKGKQRDHNEDTLFTLTTTMLSDTTNINFGLYIVADGMGGHKHGEMASGTAARAMAKHVVGTCYTPIFGLPPDPPSQSLQEIMHEGVQVAQNETKKQIPGGGTTLTAVLILGDQLTIAHVGDSRAYFIDPNGRMDVLTRDHSLVRRLEELGQITAEEAAIHPQRNVLYRALGQGESFDAEITTTPLPHSGHLLVCSDGLWGVIPQGEISNIVTSAPSPVLACQDLVKAANDAGGPDNITAILVRLPE